MNRGQVNRSNGRIDLVLSSWSVCPINSQCRQLANELFEIANRSDISTRRAPDKFFEGVVMPDARIDDCSTRHITTSSKNLHSFQDVAFRHVIHLTKEQREGVQELEEELRKANPWGK